MKQLHKPHQRAQTHTHTDLVGFGISLTIDIDVIKAGRYRGWGECEKNVRLWKMKKKKEGKTRWGRKLCGPWYSRPLRVEWFYKFAFLLRLFVLLRHNRGTFKKREEERTRTQSEIKTYESRVLHGNWHKSTFSLLRGVARGGGWEKHFSSNLAGPIAGEGKTRNLFRLANVEKKKLCILWR